MEKPLIWQHCQKQICDIFRVSPLFSWHVTYVMKNSMPGMNSGMEFHTCTLKKFSWKLQIKYIFWNFYIKSFWKYSMTCRILCLTLKNSKTTLEKFQYWKQNPIGIRIFLVNYWNNSIEDYFFNYYWKILSLMYWKITIFFYSTD